MNKIIVESEILLYFAPVLASGVCALSCAAAGWREQRK